MANNNNKKGFVLTAIKPDGLRHMVQANNGRNIYLTLEEAQQQLNDVINNNPAETVLKHYGEKLAVTPTALYDSGDSTRTVFGYDPLCVECAAEIMPLDVDNYNLSDEHCMECCRKQVPADTRFNLLSPDGFDTEREDNVYTGIDALFAAFAKFRGRYEAQGYYSSVEYGKIDLDQLANYMQVGVVENDEEEDVEEAEDTTYTAF